MVNDEVNYEYGVDIDRSWSFVDGDLKLVEYDNNIVQAVTNCLNTELDELYVFYTGYGSILKSFLGWKANNLTLNFMKLEIDKALSRDPRLNKFTSMVNYNGNGEIEINIVVSSLNNSNTNVNLVLNEFGDITVEGE